MAESVTLPDPSDVGEQTVGGTIAPDIHVGPGRIFLTAPPPHSFDLYAPPAPSSPPSLSQALGERRIDLDD